MYDPEGSECGACQNKWEDTSLPDSCPACGSEDVYLVYQEIPELDEDLERVYLAEQRIPRDERGIHFPTEIVAWLALHGVTDEAEINLYAEWWFAISSAREAEQSKRLDQQRAETETDD